MKSGTLGCVVFAPNLTLYIQDTEVGLFKVLFEEVGVQMFLEDGQGLCCPSFRGKLVPPLGCQDREELGLG